MLDTAPRETELQMDSPDQLWRIGPGELLLLLPITVAEIGKSTVDK